MERGLDFNHAPEWLAYCQTLEPMIEKIVQKYMSHDDGLAQDAAQMARIAVATLRPERIRATMRKELTTSWDAFLRNYCALVIRNSVLGLLSSPRQGDWYSGRTVQRTDKATGETYKVFQPSRLSSLDMLTQYHGLEVAEDGSTTWGSASEDGFLSDEEPSAFDGYSAGSPVDPVPSDANEDRILTRIMAEAALARLTPTERALVQDRMDGYTYGEIGERHGFAPGTANNRLQRLYAKLGGRNVTLTRQTVGPSSSRHARRLSSRLTLAQIVDLRRQYRTGDSMRRLAAQFGLDQKTLSDGVLKGVTRDAA